MRLYLLAAVTLVLVVGCAVAQPANVALDKPYRLNMTPQERYGDTNGPEKFAEGKFYRGELTDGEHGPANHKTGHWVGWRDTSYSDPVKVTVDLGEPTTIRRVKATVCAKNNEITPPPTVDIMVRSEDFALADWLQVGQMTPEPPFEPGDEAIYTYEMTLRPLRTDMVELWFHEQTWHYLYVDEIEIYKATEEPAEVMPVRDVTIEAEATGAEAVKVEGASGSAVVLDEAGESLDLSIPLPAGDYTIRIRSLAKEPDTFSEIAPKAGSYQMRKQAVTNNVFTWQRSHFEHPEDGPAQISIPLIEGAGIYIDQIRIHGATLDEPIKEVVTFNQGTDLVGDGNVQCMIVHGDNGEYAEQAGRIADAIKRRSGVRPPIKSGDDVTPEDFHSGHMVLLGTRETNFGVLKTKPNPWCSIPRPSEDGSPQVWVSVNPKGADYNVIVVGGYDNAQVRASTDEFLNRLQGQKTVMYPFELVPLARQKSDRDHYKNIAIESSTWIRTGRLRGLLSAWNDHPDDLFRLIGYRLLEYQDSADTLRRGDPSTHMEIYKIIGRWDRSEHNDIFSRLQRLQLTNLLRQQGNVARGDFNWQCVRRPEGKKGYHSHEEIEQIMSEHEPGPANNHQTFCNMSVYTVETYFDRYYDIPDARDWLRWVDTFMAGQLVTSKPQEDCTGYHHITMNHTSMYAAATGRWEYFLRDPMYQFIRLEYISTDNMGSETSYGDHGGYEKAVGPDFLDKTVSHWKSWCGGRMEPERVTEPGLLGIYRHRLEPMYYRRHSGGELLPLEKSFDKLTFREEINPDRAYLLLDGISYGYHGHHDGNAILRFTDDNRCWLGDIGSYFCKAPKDHNTLTLMRNAQGGEPPTFNSLEASFETPEWASSCTRSSDYVSMDWDRHIIWHRPSDTFFLIDEAAAREPGSYDLKARFRGHGEAKLDNRVWSLEQEGGVHFFMHLPGSGVITTTTAPDYAKYWEKYPHADPTPKLLNHRLVSELDSGERMFLKCAFYANGTGDSPRIRVREFSPTTMVVEGDMNAIIGADRVKARNLQASARQFVFAGDTVYMVDGVNAFIGNCSITSDHAVDLRLDLENGKGTVAVEAPGTLSLELIPGMPTEEAAATVSMKLENAPEVIYLDGGEIRPNDEGVFVMQLSPGDHSLEGEFGALAGAVDAAFDQMWAAAAEDGGRAEEEKPTRNMKPAFSHDLPSAVTTTAVGELNGDDSQEVLIGCEDGSVVALDASGGELWTMKFEGRVNDLAASDLDGDGKDEVLVGTNDEHVHVLKPDGSELWSKYVQAYSSHGGGPGHVTVVFSDDFDGDGTPEVVYGSENTFFYVVDKDGNPMTTDGEAWEMQHGHTAYDVAAADITGDGQKELFATWEWRTRWIGDFTKSGQRDRTFYVGGGSGGSLVVTADIDEDDNKEGIFGGISGGLVVATGREDRDRAIIAWEKKIGDDVISALVPADYDGDGKAEIGVASHSGFLALVEGDGGVAWVKYADHRVTDASLVKLQDGPGIARSSYDGSVTVHAGDGEELARWNVGDMLSAIETVKAADDTLLIVATDGAVKAATLEL